MKNEEKRVMVGIDCDLAKKLDEIGFNVRIKTRPSIIAYLIGKYESDLE